MSAEVDPLLTERTVILYLYQLEVIHSKVEMHYSASIRHGFIKHGLYHIRLHLRFDITTLQIQCLKSQNKMVILPGNFISLGLKFYYLAQYLFVSQIIYNRTNLKSSSTSDTNEHEQQQHMNEHDEQQQQQQMNEHEQQPRGKH